MAKRLDLCGIRKTAEAFGVHRADGDPLVQGPSSVIGTNEVAPLSMAVAFAGIANNGVTCTPIAIDRITDRDGKDVPVPHFGIVLEWEQWHALAKRLREAGVRFEIEPGVRFRGEVGEQATMFLFDPSGSALEFKSFKDPAKLFAR